MATKMGMNLSKMGGAWYVVDEAVCTRSVLSTGYRTKAQARARRREIWNALCYQRRLKPETIERIRRGCAQHLGMVA